jgi:putative ABC transport system permease protein
VENLIRDLRMALRGLGKNPSFTAAAVACLALGVGVTTAMFSIVNGVLLRPLPYQNPDQVAVLHNRFVARDQDRVPFSGHEYLDMKRLIETREGLRGFTAIGAYTPQYLNLTGEGEPERLVGGRASRSLFTTLGVSPVLGRGFAEEEDVYGKNGVALLSHKLWQRRFGGDRAVLDKTLTLNNQSFRVIGVLPADFRLGPIEFDLYVPLAPNLGQLPPRPARGLELMARLDPGVTPELAQQDLDRVARSFASQFPDVYPKDSGYGMTVKNAKDALVGGQRARLLGLLAASALVLFVACVNVANLLFARATSREKEVAIATALGADRGDLFRRFLVEGLLLAGAGAALGVLLAAWATQGLVAVSPLQLPRLTEVGIDGRALAFALGAAISTGVVFGLLPAWKARQGSAFEILKEGGKTSDGGALGGRLRKTLVGLELALALVVLIGAALVIRSSRKIESLSPGFQSDRVVSARIFLSPAVYPRPDLQVGFFDRLIERVGALPGVERAGAVSHLPLGALVPQTGGVRAEGRAPADGAEPPDAQWFVATPGYFETLNLPIVAGRGFATADHASATPVAVLNADLAKRLFGDTSALGQRVMIDRVGGPSAWLQVVGVVGNVKQRALDEPDQPQIYFAHAQYPWVAMAVVARTAAAPESLSSALRGVVRELDPNQPVVDLQPVAALVHGSTSDRRFAAQFFGLFGGIALLLSALGVYGVMLYSVGQRTREIGVRMALGADRGSVVSLIVGQGMRVAFAGLVAGLAGAWGASRFLESQLYGLDGVDLPTYLGVTVLLALFALLACFLPARRATRVDPVDALRSE